MSCFPRACICQLEGRLAERWIQDSVKAMPFIRNTAIRSMKFALWQITECTKIKLKTEKKVNENKQKKRTKS